jgi:hypothetical protein
MLADDILHLTFFPVGTILMYDGGGWTDNVTLKGWYRCDAANAAAGRTPDLTDKFIMGGSSKGVTGGSNSITLATNNLPAHNHSLSGLSLSGLSVSGGAHLHTGTGTTNSGSGGHQHTNISGSTNSTSKTLTGTMYALIHNYNASAPTGICSTYSPVDTPDGDDGSPNMPARTISIDATHSHGFSGSTPPNDGTHGHDVAVNIPEGGSHTHNISGGTISGGTIGDTGSGTAFDNRPSYYALIYTRKCT